MEASTTFKIALNTAVQGLGKLVTASSTFLIIVILGRRLGEAGYGDLAKAFALVEIFYIVSDFGFNAIAVREMARNKKKENWFFGNLLGLRISWGMFLVLFVSALAIFLPYDQNLNQGFSPISKLVVVAFSLSILLQGLFTTANSIFQAKLRYDQSVLAASVGAAAKLVLIFFLAQKTNSLIIFTLALIFGDAIMVIMALSLVRKMIGFLKPLFVIDSWRFLFKEALPIGLALAFNLLYFKSDTVILSFFRGSEEVGNYSLAYRFFEATLVVPIFFANALYPILLSHHQKGTGKLKNTLNLASIVMLFVSLVVIILVFASAPLLIKFFFQERFSQSVTALRILILGLPFFYTSAIYMWFLVSIEKHKNLMVIYGMAAIITLLANLVFIPIFGFLAAAWITVFGEGLVLLANVLAVNMFFGKMKTQAI